MNSTIFRHHQIEVHNADCMEVMARFPDKYFELAIVDPPYGIGAGGNSFKSGTRKKISNFHKAKDWDNSIPSEEYFLELFRVSQMQIVWGGNYMTEFLPPSKGWVFWDKETGENTYGDGELAWTSFDKVVKKFSKFWSGAQAKEKDQPDRIHPTQKPVALYRWLLSNYTKPGWKILDTHGGSLSSAIACHYAGNPLVACELDPDYFREACARLVRETAQAELPILTQPQHEQTTLI